MLNLGKLYSERDRCSIYKQYRKRFEKNPQKQLPRQGAVLNLDPQVSERNMI